MLLLSSAEKGKNETLRVLSAKAYLIGPGPSPGHARLPQLRPAPLVPDSRGPPSLNVALALVGAPVQPWPSVSHLLGS